MQEVQFYLNKTKLIEKYQKFSNIGQIYYPLKTNSNETIIKELIELYKDSNNGFLVTYLSHYNKLKKLGVSPLNMYVANVNATDEEIREFYNKGIKTFTFDNIKSLQNFIEYADLKTVRISIRLNICEVFNVYSHLGAYLNECKNMLNLLKEKGNSNFGISFYLQKETLPDKDALNKMLEYIIENFKDMNLKFINIGGGINPDEINKEELDKIRKELNVEYIIIEPGRHFVGNSGYMETKIIKQKQDNVFIIQNGIYSGLLDAKLYDKTFDLSIDVNEEVIKLSSTPFADSKEINIYGSSSDSGDIIGTYYIKNEYFSKIEVGTKIIVNNALAYVEEFFMPLGGDLTVKYNIIEN